MKEFLHYYVLPDGTLVHKKTGAVKYSWLNKGRASFYLRTQFWINGKKKNIYVHRLVAMLHLPDWDESLEVDHIDGDSLNNHYTNLRMVCGVENANLREDEKVKVKDKIKVTKVLKSNRNCVFKYGYVRAVLAY